MTQRTRTRFLWSGLLVSVWLAGCAGGLLAPKRDQPAFKQPAFKQPAMSMQQAQQTVRLGASRKAEVLATLGLATVVRFDSAYEVWVYRGADVARKQAAGSGAELVVLFDPAGIAVKSRLRPADPLKPGQAENE